MLAIMTELSAITAANKSEYGRLAQLVEHLLDVQEVHSDLRTEQVSTSKRERCMFGLCDKIAVTLIMSAVSSAGRALA